MTYEEYCEMFKNGYDDTRRYKKIQEDKKRQIKHNYVTLNLGIFPVVQRS